MDTMAPPRTPHPLQSGLYPGFLWVLRFTLGLAAPVAVLLLSPPAGRRYTWKEGVLTPDMTVLLGSAVALVALVAIGVAQQKVRTSLNMRIPGRLLNDGPSKTMVPTLTAALCGSIIIASSALYAATYSLGDHGMTKMMIVVFGVCILALLPARIVLAWAGTKAGRRERVTVASVDSVSAGILLLAVSPLASEGVFYSALKDFGIDTLTMFAILLPLTLGVVWVAAKKTRDDQANDEGEGLLRTVSARIVDARIASPTLEHYRKARRLLMVAVVVGVILAVALVTGANFLISL